MAPTKRKVEEVKPEMVTKKVTRSSTRLGAESSKLQLAARENLKKKASKKGKAGHKAEPEKEQAQEADTEEDKGKGKPAITKTIIVEHCKQCVHFKNRALLVKDGLEKGVSGITVLLNPEKPRRGCFEIREEGGQTFISLLDMKRPFKPMKDLDMEKVIADVMHKIK